MLFRLQCTGFLVQYCLESLGQHCTGFLPVQYCSKSITMTLSRIFSCAILSGAFLTTFHKVFTCAMLSKSIRTALNRIFFQQCCLEPLRQRCTRFLPVQCCPKSIKTMLFGAFWTTLHKDFTRAMLVHDFYEENNLYNVVLTMLGQHCIGILFSQCYPNTSETTLRQKNTCEMLPTAHEQLCTAK